jgi:hypothetical protein
MDRKHGRPPTRAAAARAANTISYFASFGRPVFAPHKQVDSAFPIDVHAINHYMELIEDPAPTKSLEQKRLKNLRERREKIKRAWKPRKFPKKKRKINSVKKPSKNGLKPADALP